MSAVIDIETAVYTAYRGYSWSRIPSAVGMDRIASLYHMAAEIRDEFPSADAVDSGVVSDGVVAAAFTIFTAPCWDVEGRAAEYAAFAFVPCTDAAAVNFEVLLGDGFFSVPEHEPPSAIEYSGPPASSPALDAAGRLLSGCTIDDFDLASAGALLATYGSKCGRWVIRRGRDSDAATAKCGPWHIGANTLKG